VGYNLCSREMKYDLHGFLQTSKDEYVNILEKSTIIFCICKSMNNPKDNQTLSNM